MQGTFCVGLGYCSYIHVITVYIIKFLFFSLNKERKERNKRVKNWRLLCSTLSKNGTKNIHNLIKLIFMPQANIVWIKMKLIKFGLANQQRYYIEKN